MTIRHIPDGQDFQFDRSFGFHGSAEGHKAEPPFAGDVPTRGSKKVPEPMDVGGGDYAKGGAMHHHPHGHHVVHSEHHAATGGMMHHHAHGGHSIEHPDGHMTHHHHDGSPAHAAHGGGMHSSMHPHGHHVSHVEHRSDGNVVMHHAHGGHTVCHAHGGMTHHHQDGSPVHEGMMHGIEQMHDSSEYAHGGHHRSDMAQDKAMIKKAFMQHENHEHHGEHTDLHLARGGMRHATLPRGMKAPIMQHHSPIETPPRNPKFSRSPRNEMPGGQMAYGVEPSAEPDMAGSEQGITQMKRGGHRKMR